jgi:hypothetical protein
MAWEAQDIHGRLWRGVGGSSEDEVRAFWAGAEDLLGSGIQDESEVGLDELADPWLGALFGARGSRGARGVKALEEPLLPTNHNICKESMNFQSHACRPERTAYRAGLSGTVASIGSGFSVLAI